MFTALLLDGALKLVQVIRYKDKPAVARVYDPKATVPESIMVASKYDDDRFLDENSLKEYRNTPHGMVAI